MGYQSTEVVVTVPKVASKIIVAARKLVVNVHRYVDAYLVRTTK